MQVGQGCTASTGSSRWEAPSCLLLRLLEAPSHLWSCGPSIPSLRPSSPGCSTSMSLIFCLLWGHCLLEARRTSSHILHSFTSAKKTLFPSNVPLWDFVRMWILGTLCSPGGPCMLPLVAQRGLCICFMRANTCPSALTVCVWLCGHPGWVVVPSGV